MKKNQVNAIFNDQVKRKKQIICFCIAIAIFFIIASLLFIGYIKEKKGSLVYYKENSNVDYKVFLKDNSFFETGYLDEQNRYIASLIDYINATFKYEISMDNNDVTFDYSYRIEAEVSVKEKTSSKPLFNKKYELLSKKQNTTNGESNVVINENLNINYNEYNDLIKNFVNIYGLDETDSTLTLNMYVDVNGSCEKFEEDSNNSTVITLEIPLTTKTVGIDIKNNLVESKDNVMLCKNESVMKEILLLILSFASLITSLVLIIKLVKFIRTSRTARTVYEVELKKILGYYHSYIQKVENKIKLTKENFIELDGEHLYKNCHVLRLENFTDMLEIRDSLNTPIIMSSYNDATSFIIIDALNKVIYAYELRVKSGRKTIKKRIEK